VRFFLLRLNPQIKAANLNLVIGRYLRALFAREFVTAEQR
jgi:hypothetical protein